MLMSNTLLISFSSVSYNSDGIRLMKPGLIPVYIIYKEEYVLVRATYNGALSNPGSEQFGINTVSN